MICKPQYLPGDTSKDKLIEQYIRVNHAGEYGAKRIYEGQLSVIHDHKIYETIYEMKEQELEHLAYFNSQISAKRVRPSALFYIWHFYGYLLGQITGLLGKDITFITTESVEDVITDHYQQQFETLSDSDTELKNKIKQFLNDEQEHHDIAASSLSQNSHIGTYLSKVIITYITKISVKIAKYI